MKSEERVLEWENQAKNPIKREKEVVNIPNGSSSPSLSSPNIYSSKQDIPTKACPNIYKKGACSPPTELPTVMLQSVITLRGEEGEKNDEALMH